MHIVLGVLGAIVTILILLKRLSDAGLDIGWLNPFLWHRRRKWRQQVTGDPIFMIDHPMDVTALLMTAVAKSDGDMTVGQKTAILDLFQREFHLSQKDAAAMLSSRVFLLKDGEALRGNVKKVLEPSLEKFSQEQADSAISLLERVARCEGDGPSAIQLELIEQVKALMAARFAPQGKWGPAAG